MQYATLVPFNSPLNIEQQRIIEEPYKEIGLSRAMAFAIETPNIKNDVLKFNPNIIVPTLAISCASTLDTSLAITKIGKQHSENFKSQFILCAKATAAALLVFESVAILYNLKEIQSSPAYQAWKSNRIKIMKDESINVLLKKDDILRHLLCPISGEIPDIPATVKNFDGAFDYTVAIQWMNQNPGIPLPGLSWVVRKEELKFDFAHINSIIERLYELNTHVQSEVKKKIYTIMCVNTSDQQSIKNLDTFIFIAQIISWNKIMTITELFSGCKASHKESLTFLYKIENICFTKNVVYKNTKTQNINEGMAKIGRMPIATSTEIQIRIYKEEKFKRNVKNMKLIRKFVNQNIMGYINQYLGREPTYTYILHREHVPGDDARIDLLMDR